MSTPFCYTSARPNFIVISKGLSKKPRTLAVITTEPFNVAQDKLSGGEICWKHTHDTTRCFNSY